VVGTNFLQGRSDSPLTLGTRFFTRQRQVGVAPDAPEGLPVIVEPLVRQLLLPQPVVGMNRQVAICSGGLHRRHRPPIQA